ncbi:MAG: phosphotransferase, partial [Chloroflexota bacterium]|nr:phosphotransferase [Chloroflexota bacterium]
MANVAVPRGIEDVTAGWLTAALREGGLDVRVASVEPESIGEGVGVNGLTLRLRVWYEPGCDGPPSFVLKLPPTHPASKDIGLRLGFYENEIRFYDELARNVSVNLPRHYYTGMDKERHDYALLLEDMAPALPGDDIASCSWDAAAAIVDELPKLHVPWWNSELLPTLEWLPVGEPNIEAANERFQSTLFPATMNNYGNTISQTAYRVAEKYSRGLVHIVRQMTAAPYTLTHSDYRLVNMLLGGREGKRRVTVLDWQRVALGKGPIDVAFFT